MPGTVSSESEMIRMIESGKPPKKPAINASTRPTPTPTKPAMRPILRVLPTPSAITVHRSRPWVSVPSQCPTPGGTRGTVAPTFAILELTTSGPMIANRTIAVSMASPMISCLVIRGS